MDEKDILGKKFMDMSDANQWAREVMSPNQTGFVSSDGKFTPDGKGLDYWTTMIDDLTIRSEKDTDENGWSNKEIEYKTIWEFTGQNPGKDLGMIVFNASLDQGVKSIKKHDDRYEYRAYPVAWLEMWFRDYDAKLSMEVYNKERAKEALKKLKQDKL